MIELTADGTHDAKASSDPVKDRSNWEIGNDVGRYAASLTEMVNDAIVPKVPVDVVFKKRIFGIHSNLHNESD